MRARATLGLVLVTALTASGAGRSEEVTCVPPGEAEGPAAELPADVTLGMIVARRKHTCDVVDGTVTNRRDGPTYRAEIDEFMPRLLALRADSLDAEAERPGAPGAVRSLARFLRGTRGPDDIAEAVIRANRIEKLYRTSDLIDAAAKTCSGRAVARWREQYSDEK